MRAIVLAGGLGTRLRSVLPDTPKSMAPMGEKPFLAILLERMKEWGFSEVVLAVGYCADSINEYFGGEYAGVQIRYSRETTPLGTGGAIKQALGSIEPGSVFVLNGDTMLEAEYQEMWRTHSSTAALLTICAVEVEDASRYGGVRVEDGRITGFAEKAASGRGLINAGVYIVSTDLFDGHELGDSFSFEHDFLGPSLADIDPGAFVTTGYFVDIGVPDDYRSAERRLKS